MAEEEIPLDAATAMPAQEGGAARTMEQPVPSVTRPRTTSGSSNKSSGSHSSGMGADLGKRPTRLFKRKQIFVEMDELRGDTWRETHRWNFGLEEDLDEDGDPKWNHPHLPWYSATGMTSFYEELDDDNVFLDVPGNNIPDVVDFITKKLLANGSLNRSNAPKFRHAMLLHSEQQQDEEGSDPITNSPKKSKPARKHLPSYKPDLSRERMSSRDSRTSERSQEDDRLTDEELAAIVAAELAAGDAGGADDAEDDDGGDLNEETGSAPPSPTRKPRVRTMSTSSVSGAPHIVHDKNAVDAEEFELLCPDEMEEAADILVGDVEWLDDDLIVFCRLKNPIDLRLERHAPGRFLVIVMGNFGDDASGHIRHLEIGEACAALLQDEEVVTAAYDAQDADALIDAVELKIHKLTMLPHIHRPTLEGVDKRLKRIKKELHDVSGVDMSHGGLEHYDELAQDIDLFHHFTLHNFLLVLRKWAIPLISGIVIALILKNVEPEWYKNLEAEPHHFDHEVHLNASAHDPFALGNLTTTVTTTTPMTPYHRYGREASAVAAADDHGEGAAVDGSGDHSLHEEDGHGEFHTPVLFNLSLHGHGVTFHFVVNELLMCFFFGIAIQELTESLLPGGILYPPTVQRLANPMVSTLGGVFGPITVYFILLNIFEAAGAFDDKSYTYEDLASGWGIATATDISLGWATSYLVFGHGHPGVFFHLLMAIFDDGIGLVIIAVFYQTKKSEPIWLLLNVAAMAIAYGMRRLKVGSWVLYVLIAGPISWYGLFRAAIHPALALVFVVPFMPYHHKSEDAPDEGGVEVDAAFIESGPNSTSNDAAAAAAGSSDHGAGDDDGKPISPLYYFGHNLSAFVDIFVMFLFGLVNAGVDLSNSGPYTFVVLFSLLLGKTLGIGSLATMMLYLGYPLPTTLNLKGAWLVGLVNSVGLTVALFVAGQAFYDKPEIEGEAKLGALLSLSGSILTIMISKFIDIDPPGSPGYIAKFGNEKEGQKDGDGDGDSVASSHEDDDEFLEHVIAIEFMDQLKQMHAKTKQVEMDVQFSRAQNLARLKSQLHEREEESKHEQQREKLWLAKVHAADSEHNLYHAQHKDHFHHRHHHHAADVDGSEDVGVGGSGGGGGGANGGGKDPEAFKISKTAV